MTGSEDLREIAVPRMTVAEAADLLREYERDLERADVGGEYAERVAETIADLEAALSSSE